MSVPHIYPWQHDDWARLQQLRERLPHALLFHGEAGIGKVALAEHLAASLLCERIGPNGHACGSCDSCGWFAQYGHPDYRRVRPDALETEEIDDGTEAEESSGKKTTKTPSKEIRVEQVRALATFMNVSTHRAGLRVVLLYPAEALNTTAANTLLKTLEEPPPNTLFLLVAHRIDRLLPTILSRCQRFALAPPDTAAASAWLASQEVAQPERWLAEYGGAPLAALAAAQGEAMPEKDDWLNQLARPQSINPMAVAERLQKAPLSELVAWQQRWLHDLLSLKLGARVRYFPHQQQSLTQLAARVSAEHLQQAVRDAANRRRISDHPLSARLFIEQMLLEYTALFR
ncbi:MAG: DNA polymerase III subunit delta' [Burkholderiaceae bacterium]|jgi:DNA polymerase-3 subunit delta'|nr:DNA polymerase III subunit delta' [Oxalobacteraceae bacterium]